MSAPKKKPDIRFTGFKGNWTEQKLSSIATMKARIGWQGLTQKEFLNKGDYYLITGTDFDSGGIDFRSCHFIGLDRYRQDVNIQLKAGDVLITKDGTIGKIAYINVLDKPATLNAGVFVIRGKNDTISNLYLYHYLAAPYLLEYADKQSTGGTIKHLNQNVLVSFSVPISSLAEQQKIGEFLAQLDQIITLYQCKYEKTVNLKKGLLEKMFPKEGADKPEIRFAGFTEPWARCEFSELVFRMSAVSGNKSALPRVEYEDIVSGRGQLNKDIYEKKSNKRGISFESGDILFGKLRPYLQNWLLPDFAGIAVGDFWVLRPNNTNTEFIYTLIQSPKYQIVSNLSIGTKMPRSDWRVVSKMAFSVPFNVAEQAQIGALFKHLDHLITLQQRELEKLKNIKKSLLERMFV